MATLGTKMLIIGGGAVAQCTMPLILKHIPITPDHITIIDAADTRHYLQNVLAKGVQFQQQKITKDNFVAVLSAYLQAGDICIDLANEVDTLDILTWCLDHHVRYINTNLNLWKNHSSIYATYSTLKLLIAQWPNASTAIISHGANPGLISSFAKQALLDSGTVIMRRKKISADRIQGLENALNRNAFAQMAQALDIKTIHISERDTQRTSQQKNDDEFLNTWSVIEYINECIAKVEFGWGTHEKKEPAQSNVLNHILFMETMALNVRLKSCVVQEEIIGMTPPHDETFSIADYLTVRSGEQITYRPTVIFVYDASPNARQSIHELAEHDFKMHERYHVMKSSITSGIEKMGCLIMGDLVSWWTGSVLSIEESNRLVPGQNATIMQVAAGVLAAVHIAFKYPQRGICFPEDLDHAEILAVAKPYLGNFVSKEVRWKPTEHPSWQFHDFVIDITYGKKPWIKK